MLLSNVDNTLRSCRWWRLRRACSSRRPNWPPCSKTPPWSSWPSAPTRPISSWATCRARVSCATTTSPLIPAACSSELPPIDQLRRVLANAGIGDQSKVDHLWLDDRRHADVLHARLLRPPARARAERRIERLEGNPAARLKWARPQRDGRAADAQAATRSRRVRGLDQGATVVAEDDAARRASRCGVHRRRRRHERRARQGPPARRAAAGVEHAARFVRPVPSRRRAARRSSTRLAPPRARRSSAIAWSACAPR